MIATLPATTADPRVHPRILARMKLVVLTRRQDMVLAQLDEMIVRLDAASLSTDRFLGAAEHARDLRQQMIFARVGSPKNIALLEEIKQHIAASRAIFAADTVATALSA